MVMKFHDVEPGARRPRILATKDCGFFQATGEAHAGSTRLPLRAPTISSQKAAWSGEWTEFADTAGG